MLKTIGKLIKNTYFWFLWNLGMPDMDGNYNSQIDRFPITYMLRNQKKRWTVGWYMVSLLTILLDFYWLVRIWFTSWLALIPLLLLIFFIWLFIHVDLTTDTGIFKTKSDNK